MLKLFQVDIASFAVAGAFVIFLMSLEMILDIEIFKNQGPINKAKEMPVALLALTFLPFCLRFNIIGIDPIISVRAL